MSINVIYPLITHAQEPIKLLHSYVQYCCINNNNNNDINNNLHRFLDKCPENALVEADEDDSDEKDHDER